MDGTFTITYIKDGQTHIHDYKPKTKVDPPKKPEGKL